MPILQNIPIALNAEAILTPHGERRLQPPLIEDAGRAIALGQSLWRPLAVYEWLEVRAIEGEHVYLAAPSGNGGRAELRVGPKADLLGAAQVALVGVGTIGPALEERVHELQTSGEGLHSYMLDSAGVVALGVVGEALRCLAEETALARGWGVSAALSPGSLVGWSLRGQRELCALLPLETIGVRLNDYYVLEPHKSFSVVIGLGPEYASVRVGSVCKYCALQNSCWRRREDPA
jgi:hypothetical protein